MCLRVRLEEQEALEDCAPWFDSLLPVTVSFWGVRTMAASDYMVVGIDRTLGMISYWQEQGSSRNVPCGLLLDTTKIEPTAGAQSGRCQQSMDTLALYASHRSHMGTTSVGLLSPCTFPERRHIPTVHVKVHHSLPHVTPPCPSIA